MFHLQAKHLSALPDNQANAGSASDKCYSNYTSNVFKAMMTVFSRGGNHSVPDDSIDSESEGYDSINHV